MAKFNISHEGSIDLNTEKNEDCADINDDQNQFLN